MKKKDFLQDGRKSVHPRVNSGHTTSLQNINGIDSKDVFRKVFRLNRHFSMKGDDSSGMKTVSFPVKGPFLQKASISTGNPTSHMLQKNQMFKEGVLRTYKVESSKTQRLFGNEKTKDALYLKDPLKFTAGDDFKSVVGDFIQLAEIVLEEEVIHNNDLNEIDFKALIHRLKAKWNVVRLKSEKMDVRINQEDNEGLLYSKFNGGLKDSGHCIRRLPRFATGSVKCRQL